MRKAYLTTFPVSWGFPNKQMRQNFYSDLPVRARPVTLLAPKFENILQFLFISWMFMFLKNPDLIWKSCAADFKKRGVFFLNNFNDQVRKTNFPMA